MLVRAGKVVITRNVTWAQVSLSRAPTAKLTPSVEGEEFACGRDREASSFSSVIESGDNESDSSSQGSRW